MSAQSQPKLDDLDFIWTPPFDTSVADVSAQLIELAGSREATRFCSVYIMDEFEMPAGAIEMALDLETGEVCGLLVGEFVGVDAEGNPIFGEPRRKASWFACGDADPEDALIERLYSSRQLH
jgi:hypothetical protein